MNPELRRKCAQAIVDSDVRCVNDGSFGGKFSLSLGEVAEKAAEACIEVYLRETQNTKEK